MSAAVSILDACRDPALFGRWFKNRGSWSVWFAFLAALFGLPLTDKQRAVYRECTGRSVPRPAGFNEAWLICGRRSGKSFMLAVVAVFLACFKDWSGRLIPGERGTIMIVAADRRQARVIFRYIAALITETPLIAALVYGEPTADRIDLTNGVSIEISTSHYRSVRGYTLIAALCDEIAFWQGDGTASPDTEILAALRPAMATLAPDAMLLCASSPYAQRGALYDAFRKNYGRDDAPVLVWRADTLTMNPAVPKSVIDDAYEADPASAAAEFGAQFRTDVESFIAREVVDACIVPGRHELPPVRGIRYASFADPSGGSSDAMTVAVAHREGDRVVLDCLRERKPPFSPDDVCLEFAAVLKSYGVFSVQGDHYAGQWPAERFAAHGIRYEAAAKPKSDLYRDLLPVLNASRIELLEHPKLAAQLCSLERRTARSGRDTIDHQPGGHDDLCNAVAGAAALALGHQGVVVTPESLAQVTNWSQANKRRQFGRPRSMIYPPGLIQHEKRSSPQ